MLLVRRVPADKIRVAVDSARVTAVFQDADEREIVESIDLWLTENQRKHVSGQAPRPASDDEQQESIEDIGRALIADARKALDSIEKELEKPGEGKAVGRSHQRKR